MFDVAVSGIWCVNKETLFVFGKTELANVCFLQGLYNHEYNSRNYISKFYYNGLRVYTAKQID